MQEINFNNAYYVKLGRKGCWEESCIKENKIRIGWINQSLDDINQGKWDIIREQMKQENRYQGVATMDFNALKSIVESTEEDIWITFYSSKLWWCRLGEQKIFEDEISKYRKLNGKWEDCDINGKPLIINQIPGTLAQVQAFRATICRVKAIEELKRIINAQQSQECLAILNGKIALIKEVEHGLRTLHWKDFETLIDLIFRDSGWRRISLLGETMKDVDMELEEPITGDLYQVQVKSRASVSDFESCAEKFEQENFRKLYFVVHTPDKGLLNYQPALEKNVELILPNRLASMIVELGLLNWLMKKIR